MGKIPYMPFYIGDWEQDLNACEIETEGAWLKIIVKMFKDDKCGVYKTSTRSLQYLWKSNHFKMEEIIKDLLANKVCLIERDGDTITFSNRRMKKEKDISHKRSLAVQKRYKKDTKEVQIPEYEDESEYETVIKDEDKIREIVIDFYNKQKVQFPKLVKVDDKKINDGIEIIDKLIRIDDFKLDDINEVLQFIINDDFWANKVLSLNGLRKKMPNGNIKFVNALLKNENKEVLYDRID